MIRATLQPLGILSTQLEIMAILQDMSLSTPYKIGQPAVGNLPFQGQRNCIKHGELTSMHPPPQMNELLLMILLHCGLLRTTGRIQVPSKGNAIKRWRKNFVSFSAISGMKPIGSTLGIGQLDALILGAQTVRHISTKAGRSAGSAVERTP
ncbi:hypothetical protein CDZ96_25915 [Mameliella alba]|nr:hypothetical protein CDZ96_25915 [Mameliella alba]